MKLLILFFLLNTAYSAEVFKSAVVRNENFKAVIDDVKLTNLTNEEAYEGKFFKIVKGKSDEAIRFDDSADLQLKAATTYYHLTRAREYFIKNLKSKHVAELPLMVVRIEHLNVFNEIGHFANDNLNPQFNNALSIPPGKGYPPRNIPGWDYEIWFRPSKEIHVRDIPGANSIGSKAGLTDFRNQTHMTSLKDFLVDLFRGSAFDDPEALMRTVGTSIMMEAIYQSSNIATEFFSRKIYRLDSALVPEIIYHEFSHIALSNYLELTHSTPVNEGLADYFAGKIANSKALATKINDYNLFNGKKVQKKQQYMMAFERGDYANADFVFGLLWNVGQIVGPEIESNFMYKMIEKLNTNATIRDDLLNATLSSCQETCKNQLTDRLKLYQLFQSKNL